MQGLALLLLSTGALYGPEKGGGGGKVHPLCMLISLLLVLSTMETRMLRWTKRSPTEHADPAIYNGNTGAQVGCQGFLKCFFSATACHILKPLLMLSTMKTPWGSGVPASQVNIMQQEVEPLRVYIVPSR